jgi:hypothetical protein
VRLVDLLGEAEIRQDARNAVRRTYVVATASDGYVAIFSWGELFNTAVGAGVRRVKWLSRIEVKRLPD